MRVGPLAATLTALVIAAAHERPSPARLPQEPAIRVDVDVVNVYCTVRDSKGRLVSELAKEDFELYEDGKRQQIRYFSRESNLPLTLGLLVDVSRSQERLIEAEKRAAEQFFARVLRRQDLAFLISFGPDVQLEQDLTNSQRLLRAALERLRVRADPTGLYPGPVPTVAKPRGTVLFDAVYLAAQEKLAREVGRKALVLVTDGVDMGSRVKLADAIEAAHKADAIIYSVHFFDPGAYRGFWVSPGDRELKTMSEETGGRLFRVSRSRTLEAIFDEIEQELRSQYSLGYTPSNPARDGKFRRIEIRTRNKDLRVQARKGYYALAAGQQP
ncbi:MAG: VWA domain-containing protein [Bryobacterales bacterium]|nr:VWA domain-containing protein [Bryobacteraceae bacterium]MDW8131460.1 VWA domain-containing protein [Bryobacterales bacterium]